MIEDQERGHRLFEKAGGRADGFGYSAWMEAALGITRRSVQIWNAKGYPTHIVAVFELLERLPPTRWPERWRVTGRGQAKGDRH